jgi:hypothetical protein
MALTKFEIASASLVLVGANPVTSFSATGSTEEKVCFYLWQSCVDHYLSLHPWRFATRTEQMSRVATPPSTKWQAAYIQPTGMKAMQAIRLNQSGTDLDYDRFENLILCNATETDLVYCVHTYEPPIAWWPGYFVHLMEIGFAIKLSFPLSAKLDLKDNLEKEAEIALRLGKNRDSAQQTTRKFKTDGRRSILEARRA